MKRLILTGVVLSFVLCASAQGVKQPSSTQNTKIEGEIRALEQKEHQAMLHGDAATLKQIWAPDFMVNAPFNRVTLSAQEVVDLVKAGVIKYSSFTRTIEQVMIKPGMVITMGSEAVVPVGNAPKAGQTINRRYTNIWMKEQGSWRLVARHANEILP